MKLTEQIQTQIQDLPEDAQLLLLDFIYLLKKRYPQEGNVKTQNINWVDQPFVGMWRDVPEMQDSSNWVKQLRQSHNSPSLDDSSGL
jgi:hypothetical protein